MSPITGTVVAVLSAVSAGAASLTPQPAAAGTYYCPWSDMVLRFDFIIGEKEIRIGGATGRTLPVNMGSGRFGVGLAATFAERSGDYVYSYDLTFMGEDLVVLWNTRVNINTGQVSQERGYCLDAQPEVTLSEFLAEREAEKQRDADPWAAFFPEVEPGGAPPPK